MSAPALKAIRRAAKSISPTLIIQLLSPAASLCISGIGVAVGCAVAVSVGAGVSVGSCVGVVVGIVVGVEVGQGVLVGSGVTVGGASRVSTARAVARAALTTAVASSQPGALHCATTGCAIIRKEINVATMHLMFHPKKLRLR